MSKKARIQSLPDEPEGSAFKPMSAEESHRTHENENESEDEKSPNTYQDDRSISGVNAKEVNTRSPSIDSSDKNVEQDDEEVDQNGDKVFYPEGGLQANLVTFGAWCSLFIGLGMVNIVGTLQAYLITHQLRGYSESSVSWIFSLYVFLVFFCGVQIGPIFDAKGPRVLIFIGSILIVACMMIMSICTEYWHFIIVFSLVGGLGSSLLFTPALAAIAHFYKKKRSTATGLAATGGATGGVIFPLVLRALFHKVGWAWATRCLGFIFLFFIIIANILIRSRLPPKKDAKLADVLPDFRIFLDGTGAMALVTAGTFFMEFGLFVPITYLTTYCLSNGVDTDFSYQIMSILNAGSFFGRWVPGFAADRWGRYNVMILMLLLCLVTTVGLWLPASSNQNALLPLVIIYSVIFGFASGSNISLTPTCVGQLCGTAHYGRYYATCYTVVSFSCLTGIPIAGALIEACGGKYWGLITFTTVSYFVSVICFVWVRVLIGGWKWNTIW